ncbi:MAG: magnesium transporter CorA family protein [Candidatus Jidaibacter sp.]|jgi:magnesium transporter|nr:magnesium transporter CorA family protein [Candidatus Jidaibacter sp.]
MIVAYVFSPKTGVKKVEVEAGDAIPKNTVWVDLLEPTIEEEKLIEKEFKIDAPTREEIDKIEVMSPFYKEDNCYYMTVTALNKPDKEHIDAAAIIFILHSKCLITLRHSKLKSFSYFSNRAMRYPNMCTNPDVVLEGLVESIVNSIADVLEKTGNEIDQLLVDVFEKPSDIKARKKIRKGSKPKVDSSEIEEKPGLYYTNVIKRVGRTGNLISKIRESLVSIHRMLIFFGQIDDSRFLSKKEQRARFRNLTRELHSLTEYANFLAQRNSFLLDATLGMINVEQNMIIKVFTVAAAVFLPPTLIASIYGMNFQSMPELSWSYGYPFTLLLIVLSAILPYYYFKRKGWL